MIRNESLHQFVSSAEYQQGIYASRNWGDSWHSLCSYHGKLKPSIAHFLVKNFTAPGDIILDPLSGVGTIPLEARLQNRVAIGNDISPLAATVTRAKLISINPLRWESHLNSLELQMVESLANGDPLDGFVDFGFNKRISDYFHQNTLRQILALRDVFLSGENKSATGAFLFSCFAHVLHGNRPYALSRRSHSLTPYAPSGPFEDKNVIEHIRSKAVRANSKAEVLNNIQGLAYEGDYEKLRFENWFGTVDTLITSPPFVGSMKFNSQNWMRLWLSGYDHKEIRLPNSDLETSSANTIANYRRFLVFCHDSIKPGGHIILHTGKNPRLDMAEMLKQQAVDLFTEIESVSEDVNQMERHGVRDKGSTIEHQYILLTKSP